MTKILTFILTIIIILACVTGGILYALQNYSVTLKKKADIVKISPAPTPETTSLPISEKKVDMPLYHISFSVPADLNIKVATYTANAYVSNLSEVTASSPHAVSNGSDYAKRGINTSYAILQPWTPNIYNIPFGREFNGEGKTTQLDNASLLKDGSILSPNQVTMYTYLIGDDEGHNRGKYGMAYQGDIRLDIKTTDNVVTNEAVYFKCTDNSTTGTSKECEKALKTFLSTIRVQSAQEISSPPAFDTTDYFSALEFKKKQYDTQERVLQNGIFTDKNNSFSYFAATQDTELTNLADNELQVMRCMPQQLYITQQGYPYYSQTEEKNIYTIRTTDGNNLFHEVRVTDPNLLRVIEKLKTHNPELKQFFACQTDDGRYIIKYNLNQAQPNTQTIQANIAIMNTQGEIQDIATILLPLTTLICEKPLALTKENIFYFGCQAIESNGTSLSNVVYIYKVDLNAKTEKLLSLCESTSDLNDSKPTIVCQ